MSYRIMITLNALVVAVLGGFFLLLPETALTFFGTEIYVATLLLARFFGGALLMSGAFLWFLKDFEGSHRSIGLTLLVGSVGGFILTLIGMEVSGVIRSNAWILLILYGLFALGYAFLVFLQPKMK